MIETQAGTPANPVMTPTFETVLARFYDAWRARDTPRLLAMFSTRSDTRYWGTDHFESIGGRQQVEQEFPGWIATCPPWVEFTSLSRVMEIRPDIAWAAEDVRASWTDTRRSGVVPFRITTIWEPEAGEWKLVHANIASPQS